MKSSTLALVLALGVCGAVPFSHAQSGAYATGHYRNVFVEAGHSQPETHSKIAAAYRQLFHGDPQNQALCYSAGANSNGPLAYLCDRWQR